MQRIDTSIAAPSESKPLVQSEILLDRCWESNSFSIPALEGNRWLLKSGWMKKDDLDKENTDVGVLNLIDMQTNEVYPNFHLAPGYSITTASAAGPNRFVLQTMKIDNLSPGKVSILELERKSADTEEKTHRSAPTKTVTELHLGKNIRNVLSLPNGALVTIHQANLIFEDTENDDVPESFVFDNDKEYLLQVWNISDLAKPKCTHHFLIPGEYHSGALRYYENKIYSLSIDITSKEDEPIYVCDLTSSEPPRALQIGRDVVNFIIQPTEKLLIASLHTGEIRFFNIDNLSPISGEIRLPTVEIERKKNYEPKAGGFGMRLLNSGTHFIAWDWHNETATLHLCSVADRAHVETTTLRFVNKISAKIEFVTNVEDNIVAVEMRTQDSTLRPRSLVTVFDVNAFATLKHPALGAGLSVSKSSLSNLHGTFFHQPKPISADELKKEEDNTQKYMEALAKHFP